MTKLPKHITRVVVFDLDGVLFKSPQAANCERPRTSAEWDVHFQDIDAQIPNPEMIALFRAITPLWSLGDPVILTARPESARECTSAALARVGITSPVLVMRDIDLNDGGSGQWKHHVIKGWLRNGISVSFLVEDYKPSADLIRELVPVLLYERQKRKS